MKPGPPCPPNGPDHPPAGDAEAQDAAVVALAEALRRAVGSFVRKVRAMADTPREPHIDTLSDLDRHGPMTVAVLARLRLVRHQSMRMVVARLEAQGLVERAPDPADARGRIVEITEAGRTALLSSHEARTRWIASALQSGATAGERQALTEAVSVLLRLAAAPD